MADHTNTFTAHEKAALEEQAGHGIDFSNVTVVEGGFSWPDAQKAPESAADRLHRAAVRLLDELTHAYVTEEAKVELRAAINAYEADK